MNGPEAQFQGYLKDLEVRNYSPLTVLKYGHCLKTFLAHLANHRIKDLRKVGREELRRFVDEVGLGAHYSPGYVVAHIQAVKGLFKYLKNTGFVFFDFSTCLRVPRVPRPLPKDPLTGEEVRKMLEAPDMRTGLGLRDRAILETFYSTGIRLQEMTRLGVDDLDLEGGFLNVLEGKGQKDRTVPLGVHACDFLKTYLGAVRPLLLAKAKGVEGTGRVWISRRGKPMGKVDIGRMVKGYGVKAGIAKEVTPHAFRRTLAVELIRNQCDFLSVKSILGHSKSETTLRYCALSGVELREALEKCHPRFVGTESDLEAVKS